MLRSFVVRVGTCTSAAVLSCDRTTTGWQAASGSSTSAASGHVHELCTSPVYRRRPALTTREGARYDPEMSHSHRQRLALASTLLLGLTTAACSIPTDEDRAKAAEESAKKSLVAIDQGALEQKVDAEKVKKIQQQLAEVHEYRGDITGKLDQVTINAYEAFQRTSGLHPDGMLDDRTLKMLEEAAAKAGGAARKG